MARATTLLLGISPLLLGALAMRSALHVAPVPAVIPSFACALDIELRAENADPESSAPLRVSEVGAEGLQLIVEMEGFIATPRWDRTQWSVGYGARSDGPHGAISQEAAAEALREQALGISRRIIAASRVPLFQNQIDALTSFAYNVGESALLGDGSRQPSTLWSRIQEGDLDGAAREFHRWNKAGGRVLRGLTERRRREAALFAGR